jgi:ABC-type lipoprotein export system ATPase subunit
MVTSVLLKLVKVSKRFDSLPGSKPLEVLRDVSCEIAPGESVAIVGPSGSGKSTLLNIMGTLDRPSAGEVFLGDQNMAGLEAARLAQIRNRQIGFIFQSHHLLPQCSVMENVLVPTLVDPDAARRRASEGRATDLLRRVGLGERLGHRPGQLSGGERQRVAVVRALINQPQLLLADEPTGALDQQASEELAKLLLELNTEQKVTLVVVTHSVGLAQRMQRRFEIQNGQLAPG